MENDTDDENKQNQGNRGIVPYQENHRNNAK